jgi:hypothetical protein
VSKKRFLQIKDGSPLNKKLYPALQPEQYLPIDIIFDPPQFPLDNTFKKGIYGTVVVYSFSRTEKNKMQVFSFFR